MPDRHLLLALLTATGLGLLIGAVRERQHPDTAAGLRTHGLAALAAAVAFAVHPGALLVLLAALSGLVLLEYGRTRQIDHGLTGEVSLLLTALLGALALIHSELAAGLGVLAAMLLYAKVSLHRFAREVVSERELHDGLVLLASALVVLPLVPNHVIGPFAVFNPATLWTLVVLVMAISALGHVALRLVGERWGLAVAGFFAGYVSSTAAIAGFGARARESPTRLRPAVAAAMWANLASLSLFVPILLTVAPTLLPVLAPELSAAATVLLVGGLLGLRRGTIAGPMPPTAETRMFRLGQALLFAAVITAVLFVSAALRAGLGPQGAMAAAILAGLAEIHAAIATLGNLYDSGGLSAQDARWGLIGILAASVIAKTVVAWSSGGRAYGLRVAVGLLTMTGSVLALQALRAFVFK